MTRLPYRLVDVFSDRPFAGNGLCVVLLDEPEAVDDGLMLAITREMNLSETAFATRTGPATYDVRIWTPAGELPFAGHPSLGTAWVLGPGRWTQRSSGATVTVEATASGAVMTQPDATYTEVYPEDAATAFGLPLSSAPKAVVAEIGGTRHLLVPLASPLPRLRPDPERLPGAAAAVGATGIGVFAAVDDATLHARVFVPGSTVPEDPGTGSAASPIAVLARRLWSTRVDVVVLQGAEIGRPCRIEVHAEPGGITVGGAVTGCATGVFTL